MKRISMITLATILASNTVFATAYAANTSDVSKLLAQSDQSAEVKAQAQRLILLRDNLKIISANYANIEAELGSIKGKVHNGAKITGNYLAVSGAILGIAALIITPKTDFAVLTPIQNIAQSTSIYMGGISMVNGVALNVANITQKLTSMDYENTAKYIEANLDLIKTIEKNKQAGTAENVKIQAMKDLLNQAKAEVENQNLDASKGMLLKYASYVVDVVPAILLSGSIYGKNQPIAPGIFGLLSTLGTGYVSKALMMYSQLNEIQQEQVLAKIKEARANADSLIAEIESGK